MADEPADETSLLVQFTLTPTAHVRWTRALRRAAAEGAKTPEAQVMAIVEWFLAEVRPES